MNVDLLLRRVIDYIKDNSDLAPEEIIQNMPTSAIGKNEIMLLINVTKSLGDVDTDAIIQIYKSSINSVEQEVITGTLSDTRIVGTPEYALLKELNAKNSF